MKTLTEAAQTEECRTELIERIQRLIDRRVQAVRGLSGMAIRGAYKVVSGLRGGRMIASAINTLLNEFCAALDPLVIEFQEQDQAKSFDAFLRGKESRVSKALLSITDARAERANPLLQGPYKKLRGFGEAQVEAAVPEIAQIVERVLF